MSKIESNDSQNGGLEDSKIIFMEYFRLKIYRFIFALKSHLALGNLAKLESWSILSFKNRSFATLFTFFCVRFSEEENLRE